MSPLLPLSLTTRSRVGGVGVMVVIQNGGGVRVGIICRSGVWNAEWGQVGSYPERGNVYLERGVVVSNIPLPRGSIPIYNAPTLTSPIIT